MIYADNAMNIKKFSHSPHPYWLPNFMDVFTWSLPFIGEKVTEMRAGVLDVCSAEELRQLDDADIDAIREKTIVTMRNLNKVSDGYRSKRRESEAMLQLKGLVGPTGEVNPEHETKIGTFDGVASLDKANERKPTSADVAKAAIYRKSVGRY